MRRIRDGLLPRLLGALTVGLLLAPAAVDPPAAGGRQVKVEPLWDDLASADAARAYQAVWALVLSPGQTVPFLDARLHAVDVGSQPVDQLVRDLGSKLFAVREKAQG